MSEITYKDIDGKVHEVTSDSRAIDFEAMIGEYITLKNEHDAMPDYKSEPDMDTLAVFNADISHQRAQVMSALRPRAERLYGELKAIKDLGLLPDQYEAGYATLETFVNSFN
jgi:hypothetical protein